MQRSHALLVAALFLCLIAAQVYSSATAMVGSKFRSSISACNMGRAKRTFRYLDIAGRNMPEDTGPDAPSSATNDKSFGNSLYPANKVDSSDAADIVTVDYTPARKNPPIHH
ncbi:uncharacterized protein LOC131229241 [Magnolia sinica]|uniref:uncharacterized protein LOC131229241 n=1 Tax=Magnolia sinica TaxID=86752 RepID=UPI002659FD46|nr:uncharacterized protein LOC131229241 [Magnolia sinica]